MKNTYQPTGNEETFEVQPLGIRYKCEFCNNGEQIYKRSDNQNVPSSNLYLHECNKCGKTMFLPKIYPYIEWLEK